MGKRKSSKKISRIITIRLFIAVFIAFLVSSVVTYFVLYVFCKDKAYGLLQYSGTAIGLDIQSNINTELYNYSLGAQLRQMYIDGGSEEDLVLYLPPEHLGFLSDLYHER